MFQCEISKIFKAAISLNTFQQLLLKKRKFNLRSTRIGRHLNSCLRALFFHVRTSLRAYVPTYIYIYFFRAYVPSCLMIRVFMSYLRTLCLRLIIPCLSVLIFRGLTCLQSHRTSKLTYIQLMKINILIH